jgi:hypothetical protein
MNNQQGAERLAEELATYWQIRGFPNVKTWVVAEHANDNNIGTVYGVRSNLVGGLPPREQAA